MSPPRLREASLVLHLAGAADGAALAELGEIVSERGQGTDHVLGISAPLRPRGRPAPRAQPPRGPIVPRPHPTRLTRAHGSGHPGRSRSWGLPFPPRRSADRPTRARSTRATTTTAPKPRDRRAAAAEARILAPPLHPSAQTR